MCLHHKNKCFLFLFRCFFSLCNSPLQECQWADETFAAGNSPAQLHRPKECLSCCAHLRKPSSALSCLMLSLITTVELQIITKSLKRWNFPSLFNEDQGEGYVPACRIISSVSSLSICAQCVEVTRYLCFSRGSRHCREKRIC